SVSSREDEATAQRTPIGESKRSSTTRTPSARNRPFASRFERDCRARNSFVSALVSTTVHGPVIAPRYGNDRCRYILQQSMELDNVVQEYSLHTSRRCARSDRLHG